MSPISDLRPERFYNFADNMIKFVKKEKMIDMTKLAVSRVSNYGKTSKENIKSVYYKMYSCLVDSR